MCFACELIFFIRLRLKEILLYIKADITRHIIFNMQRLNHLARFYFEETNFRSMGIYETDGLL